jgi:polysaccharide biosynthesis/export protein
VVRPGDVIRVPSPPSGYVYVMGQVARPGPYQLPPAGGMTITRAIAAAGGYGNLAVPERIDFTRLLDRDREATVLLDGKAIGQRRQPDIWLKPNDVINVGTTWWALPLAVVRNGFRVSYGFGFILDRNISNDLFGPPPVNAFGQ